MSIHHLHEALTQGTTTQDEAHGRSYGWIAGVVTDIDTKLFRVKARLGKQGDNESTEWLAPLGMGSIESLPEVGDPVGVIFEDGDVNRGAYFYFPQSNTDGRPAQPIPLGTPLVGIINDMSTKLSNLISHYQAFYTAVQGHAHASFGTASVQLLPATIDPTCKDTSSGTGKGKASDGSVVASSASDAVVLAKRSRVR